MTVRFHVLILVLIVSSVATFAQSKEASPSNATKVVISSVQPKEPDPKAVKLRDLGFEKSLKQEYNDAIADYTRAIKIDPTFADAYNRRGAAYSDSQRHLKAIADFTKAIELAPKWSVPILNRAASLTILENYRDAIDDYSRLIELEPSLGFYYSARADLYEKLGNTMAAIADRKIVDALRKSKKP